MSKVLRFQNGGNKRVVRRVIRRRPAALSVAPLPGVRRVPARVLQQPIASRVKQRPELETPGNCNFRWFRIR
jgi:hypothetical protein